MKNASYDVAVVGGGSAGMAAAVAISQQGKSVVVIERDLCLGGILNQCIHNGFGLQYFNEELTGPEFAERFDGLLSETATDVFFDTTAMGIERRQDGWRVVTYSRASGAIDIQCRAVVLAMGCRERNRGNIGIPGTRPAGVFTAGLAQRLVNIEGYLPGKDVVIIGSGDIGLIMARRMTWIGAHVKAVVEIQPYPSGLTRNIVQCLNDFTIPLYLSHVVSEIHGKDRVSGVMVSPIKDGAPVESESFAISCDTILLSVGLVPDNEYSKKAGVILNPETSGPIVDGNLMTSAEGIFACGNVLHVHDLVDYVALEAESCGAYVCEYLENGRASEQIDVVSGANIRYVAPNKLVPGRQNRLFMRPMIVKNNATLEIRHGDDLIHKKKLLHIQPSEMITVVLDEKTPALTSGLQNTVEVSVR